MPFFLKRPASVTILSVFVLCITSWHTLRAVSAFASWKIQQEFGASPAYLLGSGLAWSTAGLWLAVILWQGKRLAIPAALGLTGLYLAWYWLDRLVIQAVPAPNAVFSAAVSTACLLFVIINLVLSKAFFDEERG